MPSEFKPLSPWSVQFRQIGFSVRGYAALVLVTTCMGRGIVPALPGLSVGMDQTIRVGEQLTGILSWVVAAGGLVLVVRLGGQVFRSPRLNVGYRLIAAPLSALVVALVFQAWVLRLESGWLFLLGVSSAVSALLAAVVLFFRRVTQGLGLLLSLVGASGLLHLIARGVLTAESVPPQAIVVAQWLDLGAVMLDAATLGAATLYWARRYPWRHHSWWPVMMTSVLGIAMLVIGRNLDEHASILRVFFHRAVSELFRSEELALFGAQRLCINLVTFTLAVLVLLSPKAPNNSLLVVGLLLLVQGTLDIPGSALVLLIAALLGVFWRVCEDRAQVEAQTAISIVP